MNGSIINNYCAFQIYSDPECCYSVLHFKQSLILVRSMFVCYVNYCHSCHKELIPTTIILINLNVPYYVIIKDF